ncbi:MAG TPA: cobyric acid synthase [Hyphomicrobium sp.]|nr:cobyric acid synthase [Hyphomicrobium sp.]
MSRAVMIQGTGSNVGKSLLVAGLARVLTRRGLRVLPFKPQNMSNNAAVTADGGEIGRAQALQARACGVEPHTDMNPILLKPETDTGSQVIVQGKRLTTVAAREYATLKPKLMGAVLESFERLRSCADVVIVEGAGSPAEVNLRPRDIANMGFARAANVPVVLVGDIDRGGVIAQIVGTKTVLDPADVAMIEGFIINKFRGDPSLFDEGYALISERTGWRGFGVLPHSAHASALPAEDALDLRGARRPSKAKVACLALSRIANFDDLDPIRNDPEIDLVMVDPGTAIPGDARLIIIPGSKSTRADLGFLRAQGWDIDIAAHIRRGGHMLGICGGYQMLGRTISDPDGIEGASGTDEGLGLLDVETTMTTNKQLTRVTARHRATDLAVAGYEIHIGRTSGADSARPFALVSEAPEGATSANGRIMGTYLHGLFTNDAFRQAFFANLGIELSTESYGLSVENALDALADHIEKHLDVDGILAIAR